MSLADAPAVVSAWGFNHGQASQRRANLEALRILCREYEKNSAASVRPATIAGFFWWCEQKEESDLKGLDPEANAIHVGTYHRGQGTGMAGSRLHRFGNGTLAPSMGRCGC